MMICLMLYAVAFSELPINQESMEYNCSAMVHSYSLEDFLYGKSFAIVEDEAIVHTLAAGRAFARPANQRVKGGTG